MLWFYSTRNCKYSKTFNDETIVIPITLIEICLKYLGITYIRSLTEFKRDEKNYKKQYGYIKRRILMTGLDYAGKTSIIYKLLSQYGYIKPVHHYLC